MVRESKVGIWNWRSNLEEVIKPFKFQYGFDNRDLNLDNQLAALTILYAQDSNHVECHTKCLEQQDIQTLYEAKCKEILPQGCETGAFRTTYAVHIEDYVGRW